MSGSRIVKSIILAIFVMTMIVAMISIFLGDYLTGALFGLSGSLGFFLMRKELASWRR